jgi:hypothetical protein
LKVVKLSLSQKLADYRYKALADKAKYQIDRSANQVYQVVWWS